MKLGTVEINDYTRTLEDYEQPECPKAVEEVLSRHPWTNENQIMAKLEKAKPKPAPIDMGFPLIDLSFLSLNKTGSKYFKTLPQFGVYVYKDYGFAGCYIWCNGYSYECRREERNSYRQLRDIFAAPLLEGVKASRRLRRLNGSAIAKSQWRGLIPKEVKDLVIEQHSRFDQIALIAPAEWAESATPVVEPLIVGVKCNFAYILAHFDATEKEKMVIEKFVLPEWS